MSDQPDFEKCTSGKAQDFADCVESEIPKTGLSVGDQAQVASSWLSAAVEEHLRTNRPADAKNDFLQAYDAEHPYGYDGTANMSSFLKDIKQKMSSGSSKFVLDLEIKSDGMVGGYDVKPKK